MGIMTLQKAIVILKEHNVWRKGAEIEMINPIKLSEAIDTIISAYEITNQEIIEWGQKHTVNINKINNLIDGAKAFRDGKIK